MRGKGNRSRGDRRKSRDSFYDDGGGEGSVYHETRQQRRQRERTAEGVVETLRAQWTAERDAWEAAEREES